MKAKAMKKTLSCILALTLTASMMAENLTAFATLDAPGIVEEDSAVVPTAVKGSDLIKAAAEGVYGNDKVELQSIKIEAPANFKYYYDANADTKMKVLKDFNLVATFNKVAVSDDNTKEEVTGTLTLSAPLYDANDEGTTFAYATKALLADGKVAIVDVNDDDVDIDFDTLKADPKKGTGFAVMVRLGAARWKFGTNNLVADTATFVVNELAEKEKHGELYKKALYTLKYTKNGTYYKGQTIIEALKNDKVELFYNDGNPYEVTVDGEKLSSLFLITTSPNTGKATKVENGFNINDGSKDIESTNNIDQVFGPDHYQTLTITYTDVVTSDVATADVEFELTETGVNKLELDETKKNYVKAYTLNSPFQLGSGARLVATSEAGVKSYIVSGYDGGDDETAVKWYNGSEPYTAAYLTALANYETAAAALEAAEAALKAAQASGDDTAITDATTARNAAAKDKTDRKKDLADAVKNLTAIDADDITIDFDNTVATAKDATTTATVTYGGKSYVFEGLTVDDDKVESVTFTLNTTETGDNKASTYVLGGVTKTKLSFSTLDKLEFVKGDVSFVLNYADGGKSAPTDLATALAENPKLFTLSNGAAVLGTNAEAAITGDEGSQVITLVYNGADQSEDAVPTGTIPAELITDTLSLEVKFDDTAKTTYIKGAEADTKGITVRIAHKSPQQELKSVEAGATALADLKEADGWKVTWALDKLTNDTGSSESHALTINWELGDKKVTSAWKSTNTTTANSGIKVVEEYATDFTLDTSAIKDLVIYTGTYPGTNVKIADPTADLVKNVKFTAVLKSGAAFTPVDLVAGSVGAYGEIGTITFSEPADGKITVTVPFTFAGESTPKTKTFKIPAQTIAVKEAALATATSKFEDTEAIDTSHKLTTADDANAPKTEFEVTAGEKIDIADIFATNTCGLVVTYTDGKKAFIKGFDASGDSTGYTASADYNKLTIKSFIDQSVAKKTTANIVWTTYEDDENTEAKLVSTTNIEVPITVKGEVVTGFDDTNSFKTNKPAFFVGDTETAFNYFTSNSTAAKAYTDDNRKVADNALTVTLTTKKPNNTTGKKTFNLADPEDLQFFELSEDSDPLVTSRAGTANSLTFIYKGTDIDPTVTDPIEVEVPYVVLDNYISTITVENVTKEWFTLAEFDEETKMPTAEVDGDIVVTYGDKKAGKNKDGKDIFSLKEALAGNIDTITITPPSGAISTGNNNFTVTYKDLEAGLKKEGTWVVKADNDTITDLKLTEPTKVEGYYDGDEINWAGGSVLVKSTAFPDGEKLDLGVIVKGTVKTGLYKYASYEIKYKDKDGNAVDALDDGSGKIKAAAATAGTITVTIKVGDQKTSFDIKATKNGIDTIELGTGADGNGADMLVITGNTATDEEKKAGVFKFIEGKTASLEITAGQALVTYKDGKTNTVEIKTLIANKLITVTGYDKDTVGEQTITLTYKPSEDEEYKLTFKVTVVADDVKSFVLYPDGTNPATDSADNRAFTAYIGDAAITPAEHAKAVLTTESGNTIDLDLTDSKQLAKFDFGILDTDEMTETNKPTKAIVYYTNAAGEKIKFATYYKVIQDRASVTVDKANYSTNTFAPESVTADDFAGVKITTKFDSGKADDVTDLATEIGKGDNSKYIIRIDNPTTGAKVTAATLKALKAGAHKIYISWLDTDKVVEKTTAQSVDVIIESAVIKSLTLTPPSTNFVLNQYELTELGVVKTDGPTKNVVDNSASADDTVWGKLLADKTIALNVTRSDGSTETIKYDRFAYNHVKLTCEDFKPDVVGTYTLTFTLEDVDVTLDITIKANTDVKALEITDKGVNVFGVGEDAAKVLGTWKFKAYSDAAKSTQITSAIGQHTPDGAAENKFTATADMFGEFDTTTAGEKTTTFSFGGVTTTIKYKVVAYNSVESITLTKDPNQVKYVPGEEPTLEGAEATIVYNVAKQEAYDNATERAAFTVTAEKVALKDADFTDLAFDDTSSTTPAIQYTKYAGVSAATALVSPAAPAKIQKNGGGDFTVIVSANVPKSIKLTTAPTTVYYLATDKVFDDTTAPAADKFDEKTGEITVTYQNGNDPTVVPLTDKKVKVEIVGGTGELISSGAGVDFTTTNTGAADADELAGKYTVKVTYTEVLPSVFTTYEIELKENKIEKIEYKADSLDKTAYCVGDKVEYTGGLITATLTNGKTFDIPLVANIGTDKFSVSGFDNTKTGTQTITVEYGDLSTSFDVTVDEFAVKSVALDAAGTAALNTLTWNTALTMDDIKKALKDKDAKLTLTYNDEKATTKDIAIFDAETGELTTGVVIEDVDLSTPGKKTLRIKYGEKAVEIEKTVVAKAIDNIAVVKTLDGLSDDDKKIVTSLPVLEYEEDASLDLTKGFIKVTYGDKYEYVALNDDRVYVRGFDVEKKAGDKVTLNIVFIDDDGTSSKTTLEVSIIEAKIVVTSIKPANDALTEVLGTDIGAAVNAEEVTITYDDGTTAKTTIGDTDKITYTIKDADGTPVAALNKDTKAGVYTYTIKSVEDTDFEGVTVTVTVAAVTVTEMTLSTDKLTIQKDAAAEDVQKLIATVSATLTYSDGTSVTVPVTEATKVEIDYSAVDVTKAGDYPVTVKSVENAEVTKTITVTVTDVTVTDFTVSPTTATINKNGSYDPSAFTATITYSDGTTESIKLNENNAKIKVEGTVDTSKADTYEIKVSSTEDTTKYATITITVVAKTVTSIEVTKTSIDLKVGDTLDLSGIKAKITYADGEETVDLTDESKVKVDKSEVKTDTAGTYTIKVISVEDDSKSATITVTVKDSGKIKVDEDDPTPEKPITYTNPVVAFEKSGEGWVEKAGYDSLTAAFDKTAYGAKTATGDYMFVITGKVSEAKALKFPANAKSITIVGDDSAELNLGKATTINAKNADITLNVKVTGAGLNVTVGAGKTLTVGSLVEKLGKVAGNKNSSKFVATGDVTVDNIQAFAEVDVNGDSVLTINTKGKMNNIAKLKAQVRFIDNTSTAANITADQVIFHLVQAAGAKQPFAKVTLADIISDEDSFVEVCIEDTELKEAVLDEKTPAVLWTTGKADLTKDGKISIVNIDDENNELSAVSYNKNKEIRAEFTGLLDVEVGEATESFSSFEKAFEYLADKSGAATITLTGPATLAKATLPKGLSSLTITGDGTDELTVNATAIKVTYDLAFINVPIKAKAASAAGLPINLAISTTGSKLTIEDVMFDAKSVKLGGNKKATELVIGGVNGVVDNIENFAKVTVNGAIAANKKVTVGTIAFDGGQLSLGNGAAAKIDNIEGTGVLGLTKAETAKKFKAITLTAMKADAKVTLVQVEPGEDGNGNKIMVIKDGDFEAGTVIFADKSKGAIKYGGDDAQFDASELAEGAELELNNKKVTLVIK